MTEIEKQENHRLLRDAWIIENTESDYFKAENLQKLYAYKIIPVRFFIDMVKNKKLILLKVERWTDKYELFYFKNHVCENGIHQDCTEFINRTYGQSWTLPEKQDLMNENILWRIYSASETTVRIKVRFDKLCRLVGHHNNSESKISKIRIGKVEYKSTDEIYDWTIKQRDSNQFFSDVAIFESLCIKREQFAYEQELRVLAHYPSCPQEETTLTVPPDKITIDFNPVDIIDEVEITPFADEYTVECIVNCLRMLGVDCVIKKSTIFEYTPMHICLRRTNDCN